MQPDGQPAMPEKTLKPAQIDALTRYEKARQALAECVRVDEVLNIHNQAAAAAEYARQAKDRALEDAALKIRIRAERRAGELLKQMAASGERARPGNPPSGNQHRSDVVSHDIAPTLADLGVSRDQSARWQKLAEAPENAFERAISAAKDQREKLSTKGVADRLSHERFKRVATDLAFSRKGQITPEALADYALARLPHCLYQVKRELAFAAGCAAVLLKHPELTRRKSVADRLALNVALVQARLDVAAGHGLSIKTLQALHDAIPARSGKGYAIADLVLIREIEECLTDEAAAFARWAALSD